MKTRINLLKLLFILSIPFLLAGVLMTAGAYNRYMSVEASSEQLEFIKNLPHAVNAGEKLKMPAYSENIFLEKNSALSGWVSCEYYEGRISVRRIKAKVRSSFFSSTEIEYLADARSRN